MLGKIIPPDFDNSWINFSWKLIFDCDRSIFIKSSQTLNIADFETLLYNFQEIFYSPSISSKKCFYWNILVKW